MSRLIFADLKRDFVRPRIITMQILRKENEKMKKEVEVSRKRMDSMSSKNKKVEDRCNKFKTTIANLRNQLACLQEDYSNLHKRRTNQ